MQNPISHASEGSDLDEICHPVEALCRRFDNAYWLRKDQDGGFRLSSIKR